MFKDPRSKKIVLVSHCILNQNAASDGTADYPGTFEEVIHKLVEAKFGIIQLPCPELMCLGLDRGNVKGGESEAVVENARIREALMLDNPQKKMEALVASIIYQIEEYLKYGFEIKNIIGLNRSPSCGVETTSKDNEEVSGKGVFMQMLKDELDKKAIDIEMVGIKTSKPDEALNTISEVLRHYEK
jgi:predicted secreted protein